MRRTVVSLCVAASLLAGGVAISEGLGHFATADTSVALPSPEHCQHELFLGVRGSDEKASTNSGYGVPVGSLLDHLHSQNLGRTLDSQSLDYEAVSVPDGVLYHLYRQSEDQGHQQLVNALYLAHHQCPDQHFAIAGYSQGADAAADAVTELAHGTNVDHDILSKIDGMVLFGDPRYNPADTAANANASQRQPGVLAVIPGAVGGEGLRPVWPSVLAPKVRSYCRTGDIICGLSPTLIPVCLQASALSLCVAHLSLGIRAHMIYQQGITSDAAQWLAGRILGGDGPAATTSPPVPTVSVPSTAAPTPLATSRPPAPTTALATATAPTPTPTSTPPSPVSAPPAPAPTDPNPPPLTDPGQPDLPGSAVQLGSVDLEKYCETGWSLHTSLRYPNTWGWRCVKAVGGPWQPSDQHVSVDEACAQQYGTGARSHYARYEDPQSWFCWKG